MKRPKRNQELVASSRPFLNVIGWNTSRSEFFKRRDVWIAVALQVALSIFLAHGYDFRVEYVAGRNIVDGISPYLGGTLTGWMALGYGPQVQGIGETPLWALYLGLCYLLSANQVFQFNFLSKIPIIAANVLLAYLAFSRGLKGWRFFLLNVFLIAITVTWGKPDNVATVLAILALIETDSASSSALLLSTSLMIKPLALVILPAFFSRLSAKPLRWGARFVIETFVVSAGLFLVPFVVLGWPIATVTNGFSSWFGRVGALSLFNIVALGTGTEQLPSNLWWAGYLAPFGTLVLLVYGLIRRPHDTLRYALLSAAVFFTLRPWNSEQNLVIIFTLFVLHRGDLPSRWLWIVPMCFAVANSALQPQLYLLVPTIVDDLSRFYAPFYTYLLWLMFFISLVWLVVLWLKVAPFTKKKEL